MSGYRLYFMSGFSGHIERFEEFDSAADDDAVAIARTHQGPLALELWCLHRKVIRLEALDLSSQLLARRREAIPEKDFRSAGQAGDEQPKRNKSPRSSASN